MQLQEIMPFIVALLASGGGAFVLVTLEHWLVARSESRIKTQRRLFYWGTAAFMLMSLILLVVIWELLAPDSGSAQLAFILILLSVTPLQAGILVFLAVNWRAIIGMGQQALLFLVPLAAFLIALAILNPSFALLLLALTSLVALLWQIKARVVDWLSIVVLLVLVYQKVAQPDLPFLDALTASGSSLPFGVAANIALAILMLLLYFLPASLVYHSLKAAEPQSRFLQAQRWGIAVVLLLIITYDVGENAFWANAQSRFAADNFPFQSILPVLFGLLLALFLPGWRRLAGAFYGLLVPGLLIVAYISGWNLSNHAVTEARAQRIENALKSYYQQNGRYPDLLDQLTPSALLFIPPPAGNDMDRSWCYQSGPDAYRLGYVSVKFVIPYSMPEVSVTIIQQVGKPPNANWDCDQRAQAVKAVYTARFH